MFDPHLGVLSLKPTTEDDDSDDDNDATADDCTAAKRTNAIRLNTIEPRVACGRHLLSAVAAAQKQTE